MLHHVDTELTADAGGIATFTSANVTRGRILVPYTHIVVVEAGSGIYTVECEYAPGVFIETHTDVAEANAARIPPGASSIRVTSTVGEKSTYLRTYSER